jgi:hypothetical protein
MVRKQASTLFIATKDRPAMGNLRDRIANSSKRLANIRHFLEEQQSGFFGCGRHGQQKAHVLPAVISMKYGRINSGVRLSMGCRAIWIIWLGLATTLVCTNMSPAHAQDTRARDPIPFAQLSPAMREKVRHVVDHTVLFGRGPTEAFTGDPALYRWLLDHPDRAVCAWRRLGAVCTEITGLGGGWFACTDGHGSEVRWQTAYDSPSLRIWYAEGRVRPTLLLPAAPVQIVLVLRHGNRPDGSGRTLICHQADVYFHTDNKTAALIAKMLDSSAPQLAEQGLRQIEIFFSALVWYFGQHPERTEQLLARSGNANSE